MFLHAHFDTLDVTTVELDKDICDAAKTYFGFIERPPGASGGSNAVIIADGLEVVRAVAEAATADVAKCMWLRVFVFGCVQRVVCDRLCVCTYLWLLGSQLCAEVFVPPGT